MAAILLSDCDVQRRNVGGYETILITTPATADSADTIDLTDIMFSRSIRGLTAWDSTGADTVTCTLAVSTDVITLDAGGATTDHAYHVFVDLK